MFRWVPYPFLRFTPALIVGILLGIYIPMAIPLMGVAFLFLMYALAVLAIPTKQKHRFATAIGIVGLITFATAGVVRVHQYDAAQHPSHLLHYNQAYSHYVATVTSDAERRTNSWRLTARLEHVFGRDSSGIIRPPLPLQATILLYQPLTDSLRRLTYGDRIVVKGVPQPIDPPANPHAFDLQRYWAQQQVYHQQYLRAPQWQRVTNDPPSRITQLATQLRQHSKKLLTQAVANPEARGIALALVLGVKDQLDDQVREAYGRAGAMHVLAVSGLHIGIVYGVVAFLLMPLRRFRWGKGLHALLCLLTLWLFALVSGGSVSVMRAATMFTCIIIAEATQRRANIFNTLALSAFILLLINPYYILSVGFQLSYLAVLGIVYLQPRIYCLITCRYGWLDKLWALTAVSVAAQLATLPISLYYFHQFPTYFWLANLVVIPAASVILSLGLLIIGVGSVVPSLIGGLGTLLEAVITGVNTLIFALERLPVSYLDRLHVDIPQVIGLYAGMVALILLFHYRRFRYLVYGCCFLIAVAGLKAHRNWSQRQQKGITFYQMKRQSNVDFIWGKTSYHWGEWNEQAAYQIDPHYFQAGLTLTLLDTTSTRGAVPWVQRDGLALAVWQGKRLAFVQRPPKPSGETSHPLSVDYLVISNNAVRRLSSLDGFSYQTLVIDSSNSRHRAQQLADEAEAKGIPYHSVPTQGALQIAL